MSSALSFLRVGLWRSIDIIGMNLISVSNICLSILQNCIRLALTYYLLCSDMNATSSSSECGLSGIVTGSSMKGS